MLDYRVQTFLELCRQMNYRRTAEKLNMTQPGVTQHIHFLEKYYGVKLFSYDGKTLTRTENADILKRHFESVRAAEADIRKGFLGTKLVELKVGATKTIGEFVLTPVVRAFLSRPNHRLELTVDNTENLLGMLEDSELDFAVIEGVFDKSKYSYHLFRKEKFVGICGEDHPFAGRRISLQDAFNQQLIIREPGSGTRRLLEQAIADRGFSLENFRNRASISNFSIIRDVVAREGCITFAYAPIADCAAGLAKFEVEDMQISGEFNFVYCNAPMAQRKIRCFLGDEQV